LGGITAAFAKLQSDRAIPEISPDNMPDIMEESSMSAIRGNRLNLALLLCSASMALPLWAAPALAQGTAAEETNGNDIIVTAQRRSEKLEEVPMTVQVVTAATLANSGINTIRDLANVTSGFQVNQGGSYPQPAIRGISSLAAGAYENNVAVFVDGLYEATPQVINMDLPNVKDIQILKGPQGTLYGRNATGGAILIDTIDPGNELKGQVEATYARFNDYRGRAVISGPLTDKIGFSLAGTLRHTDGYYKIASRTTPGQFSGRGLGLEQESIRAKLKFDLTDSLTATLGYNFIHASDPRGVVFTPIENVAASYVTVSGVPVPGFVGVPVPGRSTRPTGLGEVAGDAFELDYRQNEGSLKLELDTGIGKLRSITGYSLAKLRTVFDFGGSYVPDSYSPSLFRDRNIQESIDYNITAIKNVDLILGGNYYNIKLDYDKTPSSTFLGPAGYAPFVYLDPATNPVPLSDYRRSADTFFFRTKKAWAVFAAATFHVNDRLSITAGGRYSEETQNVSGYKYNYCVSPVATTAPQMGCGPIGSILPLNANPLLSGQPYNQFGAPGIPASARSSHYSRFTPSGSIRYEISPGTNIYFSYTSGFRGGEWNAAIPGDNPANYLDVKQETVNSFELGLKSGGHRLRFELAGFYSKYKDLQVSNTQILNGVPLVILTNAPSAKIYGVEGSFDYKVTDNFTIRGGATYLHARYGDNFVFTGVGVNPNVAGFNVNSDPLRTFGNQTLSQNLSGLQMARAPDFSGFLGAEYNIPNGDGGLRFAANVKYTTSYVVTNPSIFGGEPGATFNPRLLADPKALPNNSALLAGTPYAGRATEQRARQEAFALVNASVTWTDSTDHLFVRVWGNNLTDVKYRVHYNPLVGSGTYAPIGEPLTFGGTIGYKFGGDHAVLPPPPPPPPEAAPPPPPPPPPPPVAVCNKGPYLVFFDWDKSDITAEAATILDSAVNAYGNCARVPVMIAGYADRSGSPKYNQGLSDRRAVNVRGYMTSHGVADGAITTQGFGENNNRVPTADGVRELQNRRVEIGFGPGSGN
jgi:iron complex outermembrane receptor protein